MKTIEVEMDKETIGHDRPVTHMYIWDKHFKTDPAATKRVNKGGGRQITAIDAYHQIKEATEEWGPMGKWGLREIDVQVIDGMAHLTGEFFFPGGYFAMVNSIDTWMRPKNGNNRRDSDWGKKLQTDTMTKALSYLGFNADVFFGLFDDARYVEDRSKEVALAESKDRKVLYDKCLGVLEIKKDMMGKDAYSRYKESLGLISDETDRLDKALKILEAIIPETPEKEK